MKGDSMTQTPSSTQQQYPGRAAVRTAIQGFTGTLATLAVVLPSAVAIVGDTMGDYVPDDWMAYAVGASAFVGALSAAVARIMAIPAVDALLGRLASTPGDHAA